MSGSSKLRWAQYDGVYQAALHISPEEIAEVEVPAGHSAVYLLGLDSTVMVPDADLAPYDPHDTDKATHPAAALGVATAQQILDGFNSAEGPADTPLAEDDYDDDDVPYAQQQQQRRSADAVQEASDRDDDEADEDAAERRRRRREEKRLRKEEKKAAKEARKAAKAAVKREREDFTASAPALRRRRGEEDSSDDDEDDGDELLAAAASIEGKYKKKAGNAKPEREDNAWAAMEADLFSDEEDDEDDGAAGRGARRAGAAAAASSSRGLRHGNRMGQALAALNATSAMPNSAGFAASCPYAAPYLMEIHYEYDRLAQEATSAGLLLSKQEAELVRELDDELRRMAAEQGYLRSVLAQRQLASKTAADAAAAEKEADALAEAIAKLEAPTSIAAAVHRLVAKQPPASAGAFDKAATSRARRAVNRRTRTFQDTSVVMLLEQLRAAAASPREDGAEVMRRYLHQRRQHEDTKSNLRGLSKTGFYAVPKPMEKWKRGRDMMLLANAGAEAQTVRPTSYISQTYSVMRQQMKDHAEKRFDRVAISAQSGSSFLNTSSFGAAAALMSSTVSASGLPHSTPPEERFLVEQQQQQSRLAAAHGLQRREAFFQFHALRCEAEAPVTLETVPLHAAFASTAMAPSVPESVMDPISGGSRAASVGRGGGDDASVNAEEGLSVSYSTHSAAPSSYPYLFDAEPRARRGSLSRHRPHHRGRSTSRGGSVSAVSSEADGENGEEYGTNGASGRSSRATSVASAQSGAEHAAETAGAGGRRANGNAAAAGAGAAAAGAGAAAAPAKAADWRSNAKRSILEQLTLYRRGKHGKPAVLSDEQCREMCNVLLQRAMQAEADRQGMSLAVQSNNLTAAFSKTTEQRLKKSVDHYIERRMQQGTLLSSGAAGGRGDAGVLGNGAAGVLGASGAAAVAMGYGGVLSYDPVAEARQRAVADTPVFED